MNKVIIMGNLGQDPEQRWMPSGQAVTNISVATSRKWKDKTTGEPQEETSWHRCVAFGKTAETIAQYFKKGNKIMLEGRLKYGSYEKDGHKNYTTDIVIDRFEFVEKKEGGQRPLPVDDTHATTASDTTEDGMPPQSREQADDQPPPEFDDDIPF